MTDQRAERIGPATLGVPLPPPDPALAPTGDPESPLLAPGLSLPEITQCICHPASLCAVCHRCDIHDQCKCLDAMYPENQELEATMPEEPEEPNDDEKEPVYA